MCESCVAPILILIVLRKERACKAHRGLMLWWTPLICLLLSINWPYTQDTLTLLFGGFVACVRIIGVQFLILENQNRLLVCHEGNILLYDNHRIASWKIINILLGGLAIVVGIVVLIWLPDSPLHAQFLTYEERTAVLERVRDDQVGVKIKCSSRIKSRKHCLTFEFGLSFSQHALMNNLLYTTVPFSDDGWLS